MHLWKIEKLLQKVIQFTMILTGTLQWSDFKGRPVEDYFAGAVTASGFAFDSQMDFDGTNIYLNIGVYTFFTKNDSWKKPQINSGYHLLHEQHHFDITRIGAQKNLLMKYKKLILQKIIILNYSLLFLIRCIKKISDIQHLYDAETNHSINVEKQLEWNNKIAAEIKRLRAKSRNKVINCFNKIFQESIFIF